MRIDDSRIFFDIVDDRGIIRAKWYFHHSDVEKNIIVNILVINLCFNYVQWLPCECREKMSMFRKLFKKDSKGMTLIEYTLIISFIAFVIISALRVVGRGVSGTLNHLSNGFKNGEY